jgi:dTDP-4-amino-4,6-dideoxygalactose transaminase
MAVHCFGHACDVVAIETIARRHGLKVIYDASHAFGIRLDNGRSLLGYGDLSVVSFHATKVFNTFEGGAIVAPNSSVKRDIDRLTNYGIVDENSAETLGLNAKMSEIHAAMGIAHLAHVDDDIHARAIVDQRYRTLLEGVPGITPVAWPEGQNRNYYAFPVLVGKEYGMSRDDLHVRMRARGINARRYFYPLISDLPMYRQFSAQDADPLSVAKDVGERILCLPMYPDLTEDEQLRVVRAMLNS